MEPTEGIFLEITTKEKEVISRVCEKLGSEYSPNGIVRAFFTLDKYLSALNIVQGKESITSVLSKFIFR